MRKTKQIIECHKQKTSCSYYSERLSRGRYGICTAKDGINCPDERNIEVKK